MPAPFDVMAEAYDAMIDWDKRLANESPLYRDVFASVGAKSVLDTACGTGRHAQMFASWGLETEAADISAPMIEHCRASYPDAGISWQVRSFLQPANRQFDVVICTGNSLALVDNLEQVSSAVQAMVSSTRRGGALVLHVVNLACREEGVVIWDKCVRLRLSIGECLVIKGTHRCSDHGFVDFLLTSEDRPPKLTSRSMRFLSIGSDWLADQCVAAGCSNVELYGNYRLAPHDPNASSDLIVVARR